MSEKLPIPATRCSCGYPLRDLCRCCEMCDDCQHPTAEPQGILDSGAYKVAVRLPMATEVLVDDPAFAAAHPWLQSDRRARPNAWPRFSIWPFRLRRGGKA